MGRRACMRILLMILTCSLVSAGNAVSQALPKSPLSKRITSYRIDAVLNPSDKTVKGKMRAFWVNDSEDTVPDIWLHLYLNAFSSNKTTFHKERGTSPGSSREDPGWIKIISLTDCNGTDLLPVMKYVSPDDGNPYDRTVATVLLPEPVAGKDTVILEAEFESKLPSDITRTGFRKDFFFVAQWFPKFGVYEPAGMRGRKEGGWNCHQFHANSEFYSNHSLYEVNITVPQNYIVGSGGITLGEENNGDGTKTVRTRAEDIVDFAWTAWPGYQVVTDTWKHVNIKLLLPREKTNLAGRHLTALKHALEYLELNVGPYPWNHLTFIDPPVTGMGAGGMEYTTLFTTISAPGIPDYILIPEMVTVHEFGHAYFMGIIATNEFEEPWLDEGINSYWEQRIMDHYYGNAGMVNHPLLKISDKSMARSSYINSPSREAATNAEYSWNYPHGTYSMMSYQKAAAILHTLTGLTGEETMNAVFREYYKRWAFRHPSAKDFIDIVNETVLKIHGERFEPDPDRFFEQTLFGSGICDYKVIEIVNRKTGDFHGLSIQPDSSFFVERNFKADTLNVAVVQLQRDGDIQIPVQILIRFDNGDEVLEKWDGKSKVKDFRYTGKRKVTQVKIDPEFKNQMDINFINNSMAVKPERKPLKILFRRIFSIILFFMDFVFI